MNTGECRNDCESNGSVGPIVPILIPEPYFQPETIWRLTRTNGVASVPRLRRDSPDTRNITDGFFLDSFTRPAGLTLLVLVTLSGCKTGQKLSLCSHSKPAKSSWRNDLHIETESHETGLWHSGRAQIESVLREHRLRSAESWLHLEKHRVPRPAFPAHPHVWAERA